MGSSLIGVICDDTGFREVRIVMNRNGTFGIRGVDRPLAGPGRLLLGSHRTRAHVR